jgi:uncharacterized membrane protein YsdA (DUF1294 family)
MGLMSVGVGVAGALSVYLVMSVIAFAVYWADKRRAERREWRIREATLHCLELLGGWPGAWAAQQVLRHKRQKGAYMAVYWTIVAVHAVAWAWWFGVFSV